MQQGRFPLAGSRPERIVPIVGAAAVLGASGAVAARGVASYEQRAFHAVNDLPSWLTPVLWPPMQLGSLWGPLGVGWVTWRRRRSWRSAAGVVIGGVTAWQLAKVVKSFVRRGRPADELDRISPRMGTPGEGLGFVSGHSTVAFSMLTVLWPGASASERLGLLAAAGVVAFARIQNGAHLPVDTIGGAALGVIVGQLWWLVVGEDPDTSDVVGDGVGDGGLTGGSDSTEGTGGGGTG